MRVSSGGARGWRGRGVALGESSPSTGALTGLGMGGDSCARGAGFSCPTSGKVPETLPAQRQDGQMPGRLES